MIKDEVNENNENEIVEILIENIWIPAMAVDLRTMSNDRELTKVKAIRIRKLNLTN